MQQLEKHSGKLMVLLLLALTSLIGCANELEISVKPKTSASFDECLADSMENRQYTDCVDTALRYFVNNSE